MSPDPSVKLPQIAIARADMVVHDVKNHSHSTLVSLVYKIPEAIRPTIKVLNSKHV